MDSVLVIVKRMCGSRNAELLQNSIGKTITALSLGADDALHFQFSDGSKMAVFDDGQTCCESRYMRTDDNLSDYIGATLTDMELRDAPNQADEYGEHEVQFLVVKTSAGQFTMSSHNEHNGYYGGFYLAFRDEAPPTPEAE